MIASFDQESGKKQRLHTEGLGGAEWALACHVISQIVF